MTQPTELDQPAAGEPDLPEVSVKAMLKGAGPRFARDGMLPTLAFYAGNRMGGLGLGIAVATAVALAAWGFERARDRSGLLASLTLLVIVIQAGAGLVADDARAFLAPQVLTGAGWGIAFVVTAALGRPLLAAFAREMYPFPDEVVASETFRRVFMTMSLVWGASNLIRAAIRLAVLQGGDIDRYVVVNLLTGPPVMVLTILWSVWYAVSCFRKSEEWGEAVALL